MATYYSSIARSYSSTAGGPWSDVMSQEPWHSAHRTKITPTISQSGATAAEVMANVCVDDENTFGVRYAGFISPPLAQRYTFTAKISDAATDKAERVRLWIDNVLVIDQWASLSATNGGSAGAYQGTLDFSTANTHHDLVLEYKETKQSGNTKAKVELYYQTGEQTTGDTLDECKAAFSDTACDTCDTVASHRCRYDGDMVLVPSARLFQRHDLAFNIFHTGGLFATYYDNHATFPYSGTTPDKDGGVASVSVTGTKTTDYTAGCTVGCLKGSSCPGTGFACTCVVSSGQVTSVTIDTAGYGYSAEDPPTVNCAGGAGQSFFVNLDFAEGHVGGALSPAKAVVEPMVDWSGASATDRPYPDSVSNGQFSVRWMGFVKPSRTDEYTFHVPLYGAESPYSVASERVRLWVDNELIIDQWASLGLTVGGVKTGSVPSGTLSFPKADDYYSIQLDYKVVDATQIKRGWRLEWENKADRLPALYGAAAVNSSDAVARGPIRSESLMQAIVTSHVQRDDRSVWVSLSLFLSLFLSVSLSLSLSLLAPRPLLPLLSLYLSRALSDDVCMHAHARIHSGHRLL